MKLATWNVNSLKVRLPQVLDFLTTQAPDALCLQETKLEDDKFPVNDLTAVGYQAVFSGQKTYNGVGDPESKRGGGSRYRNRWLRRSAKARDRGDDRRCSHRLRLYSQRRERGIG